MKISLTTYRFIVVLLEVDIFLDGEVLDTWIMFYYLLVNTIMFYMVTINIELVNMLTIGTVSINMVIVVIVFN